MSEFRDFLEEKEEIDISKKLNENVVGTIGTALGYGAAGLITAFGATLLTLGGIKAVKGLAKLWKKIFHEFKGKAPQEIVKEVKLDPKINQIKKDIEKRSRAYEDSLKDVYGAINEKDFALAKQNFEKLDPTLKNNPDVHKAIITEITKVMKLPPLYVQSPGNTTYQKIKQVLGIKIARAAAAATEMAFKKMSGEE